MDFSAIGAAVTSLRAAGDVAKGLISLHTMAEVQAKAIELNEKIIDAQHRIFEANSAQTALIETVRELEGQIAAMEAWEAEKQRYQLATPEPGAVVFALKKSMSNGEPPHYLCANCYKQGKGSILNDLRGSDKDYSHYWKCPNCQFKATTGYNGPCPAKYAEEIATQP